MSIVLKELARPILVALPSYQEAVSFRIIMSRENWALRLVSTFAHATSVLRSTPFGVVICSGSFEDGHSWKDLLSELHKMRNPPQLIVADELTDETLWAEVLNLGCYDLLLTPFEGEEVRRVVNMAWSFRERAAEDALPHSKPLKPYTPSETALEGILGCRLD